MFQQKNFARIFVQIKGLDSIRSVVVTFRAQFTAKEGSQFCQIFCLPDIPGTELFVFNLLQPSKIVKFVNFKVFFQNLVALDDLEQCRTQISHR